jgi:predicted regulator of Ras-like GTPase activity (Roadblock/LC7/MglB family)
MSEIENIIDELLNEEQNIYGVAVIGKDGSLLTQTENWDISSDLGKINELISSEGGIGRIEIQGIRYMVVENTPERKIGTNVTGKGHIIICPIPVGGTGALVCYINPQVGPRDALFNTQDYAKKLTDII